MSFWWYARRLASMSPAEMAGRARELTKRHLRGRQVTVADADTTGTPVAFPTSPLGSPGDGDDVPEEARVRLKEAAEHLLGGRWPVLGRERDDMAPGPDWFLDPTTGRRAPDGPTASTSITAIPPRLATSSRCGSRPGTST